MDSAPLKLGLVGAGRWGRNYVHTIGRMPHVALAWIADPAPSVARDFGGLRPVYADWRTAIGKGGTDGIIVATPPRLHAEIAAAAITAGLAVLVEKPLTASAKQARDLLSLAERQNGLVWVDHVHLYSPGYRRLKDLVAPLRPIRRIVGQGGRWGPFRGDVSVLWDWGPHDIAFCLDLIGDLPSRIRTTNRESRETPEGKGEILDIELDFPDGARASVTIGNLFAQKHRRLEVVCDGGTLILDDMAGDRLTWQPVGSEPRAISCTDEPPLVCVVDAFAQAIRKPERDRTPLRLGAAVVDVLATCERNLSQGIR